MSEADAAGGMKRSRPECAICMQDEAEVTLLASHGCPTCAKEAWRICDGCHPRFLGQNCPLCNQCYSPKVYRVVENFDIRDVNIQSLSSREERKSLSKDELLAVLSKKMRTAATWKVLCDSMVAANLLVFRPLTVEERETHEKATSESLPADWGMMVITLWTGMEDSVLILEIPMARNRINDGRFEWKQSLWDEMEEYVGLVEEEDDEEEDDEEEGEGEGEAGGEAGNGQEGQAVNEAGPDAQPAPAPAPAKQEAPSQAGGAGAGAEGSKEEEGKKQGQEGEKEKEEEKEEEEEGDDEDEDDMSDDEYERRQLSLSVQRYEVTVAEARKFMGAALLADPSAVVLTALEQDIFREILEQTQQTLASWGGVGGEVLVEEQPQP